MTDWSVAWLHDCTVCGGLSSLRQCDVWCDSGSGSCSAQCPTAAAAALLTADIYHPALSLLTPG